MLTLIIGGSGSGKSAFAEHYISCLAKEKRKYYLATMQVFDEEGQAKIDRHRRAREGKGFFTIEQPTAIHKACEKMEAGVKCVLLECMSNLVANEMFKDEKTGSAVEITDKVITEIRELINQVTDLVIVSNNVFEDGGTYDEATMEYIRALGSINEKLADMADEVIEVVVGIPIVMKKGY